MIYVISDYKEKWEIRQADAVVSMLEKLGYNEVVIISPHRFYYLCNGHNQKAVLINPPKTMEEYILLLKMFDRGMPLYVLTRRHQAMSEFVQAYLSMNSWDPFSN